MHPYNPAITSPRFRPMVNSQDDPDIYAHENIINQTNGSEPVWSRQHSVNAALNPHCYYSIWGNDFWWWMIVIIHSLSLSHSAFLQVQFTADACRSTAFNWKYRTPCVFPTHLSGHFLMAAIILPGYRVTVKGQGGPDMNTVIVRSTRTNLWDDDVIL